MDDVIAKDNGIEPAPERKRQTTWKAFINSHWEVLGAIDFTTIEVWTKGGLVAEQLATGERAVKQVVLTRCNVCYSPNSRSTWGSHENYCCNAWRGGKHGHRVAPSDLSEDLIPHLVSRVIYTGAGGFNNRSPGIEFMISPRVAHLVQVTSTESTAARGIFHTKDESLSSDGYRRLHVHCGESLCSQTALWLKTAITTLVVALTEAGLRPCRAIMLTNPLEVMQRFAADTTCTASVLSSDGQRCGR
jgi:hypothetical protein